MPSSFSEKARLPTPAQIGLAGQLSQGQRQATEVLSAEHRPYAGVPPNVEDYQDSMARFLAELGAT